MASSGPASEAAASEAAASAAAASAIGSARRHSASNRAISASSSDEGWITYAVVSASSGSRIGIRAWRSSLITILIGSVGRVRACSPKVCEGRMSWASRPGQASAARV